MASCSPQTTVHTAGSSLSVMSFNIRYGTADDGENRWDARKSMVVQLLRGEDCDIIGMQEALHFQLEQIVAALPQYAYAGVGRDDGKQAGEYAAILYRKDRYRQDDGGTFWFADTPNEPGSKGWGNNVTRICTWARLIEPATGRSLLVYNVHLDHESQASRERSARLLLDSIDARGMQGPVIITGDFNAGETNPAIRILLDARDEQNVLRFIDSFRLLHPTAEDIGTYHAFKGTDHGEKIDFILVSPDIGVKSSGIIRDNLNGRYPSDHFPVWADCIVHP